jgi:hypothetical protein
VLVTGAGNLWWRALRFEALAFGAQEVTVDEVGEPLLATGAAGVVQVGERLGGPLAFGRELVEPLLCLLGQLPLTGAVLGLHASDESPAEEAAQQRIECLHLEVLVARRPRHRLVMWIDLHVSPPSGSTSP